MNVLDISVSKYYFLDAIMVMKQYDWIDWTRLKTLRAVTQSKETGLPLQQSEIARIAGM